MTIKALLASFALLAASASASAQTLPPPQNVLQLQASGTVEVQQDLLTMTLTTTREGTDPAAVQSQLRNALDAALVAVRSTVQAGQLDVRTGNLAVYPRQGRDGKIAAWVGNAELILEGRDFPRITQAAARAQTMTIGGTGFGLSREQRAKVEGEAQAQAIERFKAKAAELARNFGFAGYTLREVAVNANEPGFPRPRMMAMESKAMVSSDAAVPVEAGKAAVVVTVSGTVQLK